MPANIFGARNLSMMMASPSPTTRNIFIRKWLRRVGESGVTSTTLASNQAAPLLSKSAQHFQARKEVPETESKEM